MWRTGPTGSFSPEGAREAMRKYESLTGHRRGLEHVEYAIPIFLGDSVEAAEAAASADLRNDSILFCSAAKDKE